MKGRKHQRIQPIIAAMALARLIRNPDETEQAFRIVRALDAGQADRLVERFAASEGGARLLAERPSLLAVLADRDALAAMPEGSLGRAYLAFCEREGITAGGLVEASELEDPEEVDPDLRYVADRLRDSHDLWHVLTGYRTDLLGEISVLAFTAAQVGSRGSALLAATGYVRSYRFGPELGRRGRALVREAYARGRRAAWLPEVIFEELLARPLEEVRLDLGLESPPAYAPIYPEALATASGAPW
jgi:ubiquinone biosynthesis protein COQ4